MTDERLKNIKSQVDRLNQTTKDLRFLSFLNNLSNNELEAYFFIDSMRADCFIREITKNQGEEKGIQEISSGLDILPGCSSTKEEAIQSLIQYWEKFSNVPKPDFNLRISVIDKHEKFFREMTDEEKIFFKSC